MCPSAEGGGAHTYPLSWEGHTENDIFEPMTGAAAGATWAAPGMTMSALRNSCSRGCDLPASGTNTRMIQVDLARRTAKGGQVTWT